MAAPSKVWRVLVEHWDELEALFREEYPTKSAPKLYERMKKLIANANRHHLVHNSPQQIRVGLSVPLVTGQAQQHTQVGVVEHLRRSQRPHRFVIVAMIHPAFGAILVQIGADGNGFS